jgi:hypothetical protein
MKWNSFARSLAFAALAGAAWPAFALATGPLIGTRAALSLYLVASAAIYVAGLTPRRVHGVGAAILAAMLGAVFAAVARDPGVVALGAAIAVGVCRSGLLYRARVARALVTEATLLGGGLLLARFLAAPGSLGVALALWGFFLVQSGFFLIGGVAERPGETRGLDRFETAHRRALALLEE